MKLFEVKVTVEVPCVKFIEAESEVEAEELAQNMGDDEWLDDVAGPGMVEIDWVDERGPAPKKKKSARKDIT